MLGLCGSGCSAILRTRGTRPHSYAIPLSATPSLYVCACLSVWPPDFQGVPFFFQLILTPNVVFQILLSSGENPNSSSHITSRFKFNSNGVICLSIKVWLYERSYLEEPVELHLLLKVEEIRTSERWNERTFACVFMGIRVHTYIHRNRRLNALRYYSPSPLSYFSAAKFASECWLY